MDKLTGAPTGTAWARRGRDLVGEALQRQRQEVKGNAKRRNGCELRCTGIDEHR